ncbi:MAG: addiction module protein [Saprospiraceae bacterium]
MSIQGIKEEVRKLSRSEQAELMHYMVELLAIDNFELSEAWKAEIDRREAALDSGESVGKPAREVLAKYKRN